MALEPRLRERTLIVGTVQDAPADDQQDIRDLALRTTPSAQVVISTEGSLAIINELRSRAASPIICSVR